MGYLMLTVCPTPPADSSDAGASVVTSPSTVGDILSPLITKIGRLHCLVDNRVYLQQSASMSSMGYNAFYTHKSSQNHGLKNYGGQARGSCLRTGRTLRRLFGTQRLIKSFCLPNRS